MKLNNDDIQIEQYVNSFNQRMGDTLLNCEVCKRLFYMNGNIAKKLINNKKLLICNRCCKQ